MSKLELFKEFIDALDAKSDQELNGIIEYFEKEKYSQQPGMITLLREIQGLCNDILSSRKVEAMV